MISFWILFVSSMHLCSFTLICFTGKEAVAVLGESGVETTTSPELGTRLGSAEDSNSVLVIEGDLISAGGWETIIGTREGRFIIIPKVLSFVSCWKNWKEEK